MLLLFYMCQMSLEMYVNIMYVLFVGNCNYCLHGQAFLESTYIGNF